MRRGGAGTAGSRTLATSRTGASRRPGASTNSTSAGIAAGPDGNLWFTNITSNSIGRITPAGFVSNFTQPSISGPHEITAGPDGNLWFTNYSNNSIGRITPAGVISNFAANINSPN